MRRVDRIGGFDAVCRERDACIAAEPKAGTCRICSRDYTHDNVVRGLCPNCGTYIPHK